LIFEISSLGVTREVTQDTLRQEAFSTALTATGEGGPPTFAFHSRAKTMLLFSRAFGGLIRSFHKPENQFSWD
jgi:hypothetical protein